MEIRSKLERNILRNEKGGVLITVLIIATIFAVLAYITLQVSITSIETAETHRYRTLARITAEGGLDYGSAQLREYLSEDTSNAPHYLDPSYALSTSDDVLRQELLNTENTTAREIDNFPRTTQRTAYTFDSNVSTYSPDTDLIPGSTDDAMYRYLDDFTFSEDWPGYEFSPLLSEGDLVVYSVGEVADEEDGSALFKFFAAEFPTDQFTYDVREAGVTEPSRTAPYPYIESEHPYSGPESKAWTVTYQQDPRHNGRTLNGIRLMANPGEVQIDAGDYLLISAWLEDQKRFQSLEEIELGFPWHKLEGYTNVNEVFSLFLNTTTIGLYLKSLDPPTPGMDYGFNINGVRYNFDSDRYLPYYETPHPYDEIVRLMTPGNLNIQVIYSPFQAIPFTAEFFSQRMRIQFDPDFSLDDGDTLFVFNASDESPVAPIAMYNATNPMPADFYTPQIPRDNPDMPLGMMLVLARTSDFDTDGMQNYGYKVAGLEYTDINNDWVRVEDPIMESSHTRNLGSNSVPFNFPAFLPIPIPPPMTYAGYQTIYKPFCPNVDNPSGIGTIDSWYVSFSDGLDLSTVSDGASNEDYIRISTPLNAIIGIYDTVYFADLGSFWNGDIVDNTNNWYDVSRLRGATVDCGLADKLEIEFSSDLFDQYLANLENFGLRIDEVGYTTSDGADDDRTPPTIRSDVSYPNNPGYPAFGNGPLQISEWWYTYEDAKLIGLHFDRFNYDIEPGDRIEIFDESGIIIATLLSDAAPGGPEIGDPSNPDDPSGLQQGNTGPRIGDPYGVTYTDPSTIVNLHDTYGWVLVPGTTAQVQFIGDGDDNEGFKGFEIDHVGYVTGTDGILDYVTEYQELAYGEYYDRTSDAMNAFRSLGMD